MEDKKGLKLFVRAKHVHINKGIAEESTYSTNREGLEEVRNCIIVTGNFLGFNIMSDLREKFDSVSRKYVNKTEFPIVISASLMKNGESSDTQNYYEVVAIISEY